MVIAALIYSFCYFEIVLCCFVSLSSWETENAISWVALVLTTLPFVMLPIYFLWQFNRLFVKNLSPKLPGDTAENEEKFFDDKESLENYQYKNWLEEGDME